MSDIFRGLTGWPVTTEVRRQVTIWAALRRAALKTAGSITTRFCGVVTNHQFGRCDESANKQTMRTSSSTKFWTLYFCLKSNWYMSKIALGRELTLLGPSRGRQNPDITMQWEISIQGNCQGDIGMDIPPHPQSNIFKLILEFCHGFGVDTTGKVFDPWQKIRCQIFH